MRAGVPIQCGGHSHSVCRASPGAGTDLLARAYAQRLTELLGQPVVVENRAGASGIIGTEAAARAPADGYTILMANSSVLAINPAIRATLPYDPVGSFDPVALVGANDSALVVRTASPFRSVADLLAAAKARPGVLSYSSAGTGTSTHMAAEFFKQMAGVDILHVPYRGSPQAVTDMLGGQVDMTFNTINSVMTAVRDGAAAGRAGLALPRSNPNMSGVILYGNQQFVVSDSSPAPGSIAAAVAAANRAASDATAAEAARNDAQAAAQAAATPHPPA